MKIRFAGLITHATWEGKQYAALIADPGHTALLSVSEDHLLSVSPNLTYERTLGTYCIDISECVIVTTLGEGVPAEGSDITAVTKLLDVTTGGGEVPNPTLKDCPPDQEVFHAVVHLPPYGLLRVDDYYLKMVSFHQQDSVCLPRVVQYLINASNYANITIDVHGEPIIVRPDAEVFISNMSLPRPPNDDGPSHFELYKKFFHPPAEQIYVPEPTTDCWYGTAAVLPVCVTNSDLNVDCSNSRFP